MKRGLSAPFQSRTAGSGVRALLQLDVERVTGLLNFICAANVIRQK
jgi:hypothetical protein